MTQETTDEGRGINIPACLWRQGAERYARIQPPWSRWRDGWLLSMTSISGWEVVQYPGERPFVLSREEWMALPGSRPHDE